MKRTSRLVALLAAAIVVSAALPVRADEPIVYPAKGQSQEQQDRDQYECHEWATKDTGVDPVALAEKNLDSSKSGGNAAEGSAAKGAARGAAIGAAEGDAGAGAARGAGIGRLMGMMRAKRQLREQQSQNTEQSAQIKSQMDKFDRAYAACLTGRGYSVK